MQVETAEKKDMTSEEAELLAMLKGFGSTVDFNEAAPEGEGDDLYDPPNVQAQEEYYEWCERMERAPRVTKILF